MVWVLGQQIFSFVHLATTNVTKKCTVLVALNFGKKLTIWTKCYCAVAVK